MIEHIARYPRLRDRSIFVGDPDDIVADRFGPDLPHDPGLDRGALRLPRLRHRLRPAAPTTGTACAPSSATAPTSRLRRHRRRLRRRRRTCCAGSPPPSRRPPSGCPGCAWSLVAGPRIDPASLPGPAASRSGRSCPTLYRHLAACDLAVVQGGLTTTMELTAARRPFLYFPLAHHFEQQIHVRHRLDRYRRRPAPWTSRLDPDDLAEAIAAEIGRPSTPPVETDGAARAAALLAELI